MPDRTVPNAKKVFEEIRELFFIVCVLQSETGRNREDERRQER